MKMRLAFILITFTLLGCFVAINENNYRSLSKDDIQFFESFNLASLNRQDINNRDSLLIQEIVTADFELSFLENEYTWVHLWQAFCQNNYCQNIDAFAEQEAEFKNRGLNLMLVATTYDVAEIAQSLNHSNFSKPVYVLKDAYYGHKVRIARLKCLADLGVNTEDKSAIMVDDMIFKNNKLIYYGSKINANQLDSVLNAN